MSEYTGSYAPQDGGSAELSATEMAQAEAAGVGQHARDAGGQVVQTTADQAKQVVADTASQARDLLGEAQGQVHDQASAQQQKAAQQLRTVADDLRDMAGNGGQSSLAAELARQAADRIQGAASWLEQRDPRDLLEEVRNFARRRPGAFLIGAAVAGLAAGRLTRGLASGSDGPGGTPQNTGSAVPAAATTAPLAGTGGPAETTRPASTEAAYPDTAEHAATPGYTADWPTYPADAAYPPESAYPADPAYPAHPAYPAEPGTAPRYSGPGQP